MKEYQKGEKGSQCIMKCILELFQGKAFPRFKRVLTCMVFNVSVYDQEKTKHIKRMEEIGINEPPPPPPPLLLYSVQLRGREFQGEGQATQ